MKNIFFLVFLFFCSEIIAVPRFALMRGNQCKDCHSNPTGGIIRNEDGFRYGKNNLRLMKATQSDVSSFLNENISIGFDFRFQYLYSQELKKSDFHKMAGGVYTNFTMSDEMNFIAAYDLYRGTFEGYGILNVFPFEGYLKVGTFSPNFGVRIDDHTAYTRNGDAGVLSSSPTEGLIFASGYTQTGIEFGFFPTDFSFVTLSAGQDKFPFKTDPSYIGRIELTPSFENFNLLAGSSFGIFRSLQNKFNLTSLFGGFGVGDFTFLSEFVLAKDYVNKDIKSQVLMLETSYRIIRGLDFVARYDRIIPDTKQKNNYSSHLIFGFDFFPYSFVEIKPQFRLNLENPKVDKNNSFVLQFHFWY